MQQNGKITQWHDAAAGFVYTTSEGQRFLKSKQTGFVEPDVAKETAHVGIVDWTDGKTTLTWNAEHRYSSIGFDNKLYQNNKETIFTGLIVGAAKKNNTLIVFEVLSGLKCKFIVGETVTTISLGGYGLTQSVAISPDCTKAAFLYINENNLNLIEFTIDVANKTCVQSNLTTQDYGYDVHYENQPNLSFSKTLILAVDFDSENNLKTWTQSVDYSKTTAIDPVLPPPSDLSYISYWTDLGMVETSLGTVHLYQIIITGNITTDLTIDYNGLLAGESSYEINQTTTKYMIANDGGFVDVGTATGQAHIPEYYPVTEIADYTTSHDFIIVTDLDLRNDLVCYTKSSEPTTFRSAFPYNSFQINREYWLRKGAFSTKYKDDFALGETYDSDVDIDDVVNGVNVPISWHLLLGVINPRLFDLTIRRGLFFTTVNQHRDDSGENRVSIDLHDRFDNRIIMLKPVVGIIFSDDTFTDVIGLNRDSASFLKLKNDNTLITNSITDLIGAI